MNILYQGDNLPLMRAHIADGSIGLVYLDPPFATQRDFSLHSQSVAAASSVPGSAERSAFTDTWGWDEPRYCTVVAETKGTRLCTLLEAFVEARRRDSLAAYLVMMTPRLVELHRVLSPSGSLYLHCDSAAAHYVKVLMDALFGPRNFRREIIWRSGWVSGYKSRANNWIRNHDTLLYYVKNARLATFRAEERYRPHAAGYKRRGGGANPLGIPIDDVWDEPELYSPWIKSFSSEKCGYATQKPLALLDRILRVSSGPDDLILDPFCGGGTTLIAAHLLKRAWIGMDRSETAITLTRERLSACGVAPTDYRQYGAADR